MTCLYAVLTTTTAATTSTTTAATWSIIARFTAAASALDLERVAAKVDAVHLVDGVVGITRVFELQKSELDLDGDVANTAELAKKLVQLALTDVSGQISDVNPAHRAIRLNNS